MYTVVETKTKLRTIQMFDIVGCLLNTNTLYVQFTKVHAHTTLHGSWDFNDLFIVSEIERCQFTKVQLVCYDPKNSDLNKLFSSGGGGDSGLYRVWFTVEPLYHKHL